MGALGEAKPAGREADVELEDVPEPDDDELQLRARLLRLSVTRENVERRIAGLPPVDVDVVQQAERWAAQDRAVWQRAHERAHVSMQVRGGRIVRPLLRLRTRGRARRGRRTTLHCTPARSPGQPRPADDDPDLDDLEAAA